jgi:small subunit ribosomal protein S3Ae
LKKIKGKKWFTIVAPPFFKEKVIGETPASEEKFLIGRVVEIGAPYVTGDYEKYYIKFKFKINKVTGEKAHTIFYGLECLRDYISRLVQKRTRRVDVIQDITTKDGIKLRVKSVAVTNRIVKSSIKKRLRTFIHENVGKEVENSTLDKFLEKILSNYIKNKIQKEGSKIYPIRHFEIRRVDVLSK